MRQENQTPVATRQDATRDDDKTAQDLRGQTTRTRDQSEHRRHTWLYEDLLA